MVCDKNYYETKDIKNKIKNKIKKRNISLYDYFLNFIFSHHGNLLGCCLKL